MVFRDSLTITKGKGTTFDDGFPCLWGVILGIVAGDNTRNDEGSGYGVANKGYSVLE